MNNIPLSSQLSEQGAGLHAVYKIFRAEPLILGIIEVLLMLTGLAFLICLVISSLQWIVAGSDQNNLTAARTRLINCLVGLAISAVSLAVIYLVQYFFGLTLFPTN